MSNPPVNFGLWLVWQPESIHFFPQELKLNLILVFTPGMRVIKQEMYPFEHHPDLELAFDPIHRLVVHVASLLTSFLLEICVVL